MPETETEEIRYRTETRMDTWTDEDESIAYRRCGIYRFAHRS